MLKKISWISTLNLKLKGYDYDGWFTEEELVDLPPIEDDEEEVKEGKRIKIFNAKQAINQSSNIISTKKIWIQFIQIKK